jgi:hypothetical protein
VAALVALSKKELGLLMCKDAQTVVDVWVEWNTLFTRFCERFEASDDPEVARGESTILLDAYIRILDAIWLVHEGSPIVAKYINDEVKDLASEFTTRLRLGTPSVRNITAWQEFRTLQNRLMRDLDGYRDQVAISIEINNDAENTAIESAAESHKWSEVRSFAEWRDLFLWPGTTWRRHRNTFPMCFKDTPGEHTCQIREPEVSTWLASGESKKKKRKRSD